MRGTAATYWANLADYRQAQNPQISQWPSPIAMVAELLLSGDPNCYKPFGGLL